MDFGGPDQGVYGNVGAKHLQKPDHLSFRSSGRRDSPWNLGVATSVRTESLQPSTGIAFPLLQNFNL
jgi:hypothetical protein